MGNYDVITSGYVSMDHIIRIATPARTGMTSLVTNKGNTRVYPGGCSVNIAYALCRLGMRALPFIRVGDDYETNGLKDFLEKAKVPLDGIRIIEGEATSTCYLLQDSNNDHITVFYPGAMDGRYADDSAASRLDTLLDGVRMGVITVASRQDNQMFFEKCREKSIPVVFGMKADFDAFPKDFLREILLYSTIIFTNEAEKAMLEQLYDLEDITALFQMGNAQRIVTTLGKRGSICYEKRDGEIIKSRIGAYPVEQAADATGSGDAYIAGFLYGYLQQKDSGECGRLGSALSCFVVQKEGCCTNIPTREQLFEQSRKEGTVG